MLTPRPPTAFRFLNDAEWNIVAQVFTPARLPSRMRIVVTNGSGPKESRMAIPAALLTSAGIGFSAAPLALVGLLLGGGPIGVMIGAFLAALAGAVGGYLESALPQGYFLLVGPDGYAGMERSMERSRWLVHETAHVWHGKASWFALSYLYASVYWQFQGMLSGGDPYRYNWTHPWSSFNVEQKAQIVEDWFATGQQTTSSDPLWQFIRDCVRKGIA
jgi:hypothetical protein